jgi:CRISPR/Cas system-associated endonuclease Cas1
LKGHLPEIVDPEILSALEKNAIIKKQEEQLRDYGGLVSEMTKRLENYEERLKRIEASSEGERHQ